MIDIKGKSAAEVKAIIANLEAALNATNTKCQQLLADNTRLQNEVDHLIAETTKTVVDGGLPESAWGLLCLHLNLTPTNPAWQQCEVNMIGSEWRLCFKTEYYNSNRDLCNKLLAKLMTEAIKAKFKAERKTGYISITR